MKCRLRTESAAIPSPVRFAKSAEFSRCPSEMECSWHIFGSASLHQNCNIQYGVSMRTGTVVAQFQENLHFYSPKPHPCGNSCEHEDKADPGVVCTCILYRYCSKYIYYCFLQQTNARIVPDTKNLTYR